MEKLLIDNSNVTMADILNKCLQNKNCSLLRIATGYWDLLGTELLKDSLENFLSRDNTKLKLLIGKDPYIYYKMLNDNSWLRKARYPEDFFNLDLRKLSQELKPQYREIADMLIKYSTSASPKIEIRLFKKNDKEQVQFFHSKCYIFTYNDSMDYEMTAFVGSSNFTRNGLCRNSELNVVDNDNYFISYPSVNGRKGHIAWFEEKWKLSIEWNNGFEKILKDFRTANYQAAKQKVAEDRTSEIEYLQSSSQKVENVNKTKAKLKVILPDGTIVQEKDDAKTYVKAVLIAGIDNVRKIYPRKFSNVYIKMKSYHNIEIADGVYFMKQSNTYRKATELMKISKKCNLGWKVIVEK